MPYRETELVPCTTCMNMGWTKEDCSYCSTTGKINEELCTNCWGKGWVQVDCPDDDCENGWKKRMLPFRR